MDNYFREILKELDSISEEGTRIEKQVKNMSKTLFGICREFSWYESLRMETKKARNVLKNYLTDGEGLAKRKKKKEREKADSIMITSKLYIEFFWQEYAKSHKMYDKKILQKNFFERLELDFDRKWNESFICTRIIELKKELIKFIVEWRKDCNDREIAELRKEVIQFISDWKKENDRDEINDKEIMELKKEIIKVIRNWNKDNKEEEIVKSKKEIIQVITKWREDITKWRQDITKEEINELKEEVGRSITEWRESHTQVEDIKYLHLENLHTAMDNFGRGLELPERNMEDSVTEILTSEILSRMLGYLKAKNYAGYIFTIAPINSALWWGEPKSSVGKYFNKEYEYNLTQLKEYMFKLRELYDEYSEVISDIQKNIAT